MMVNNETGCIQPIEKIAEIRDKLNRNTALHVDAVQAFGKYKLKPSKAGVDMMSVSSHKIHGPKGVGALYISKKIKIQPVLFGGGQESFIRSGTENVQGISGFGLAAQLAFSDMDNNFKKVSGLNKMLKERLADCGFEYEILSPEDASPYILNVSFPGLKGEVLLHHLEEKGIFISTGSACSSRKNLRSHVLTAMGVQGKLIDGAVRISFSDDNTEDEVEALIEALKEIVPVITVKFRRG
jgi:cysteine desulfurase